MTETVTALVRAVHPERLSAGLVAVVNAGDTVLSVDDAAQFDPAGGWVLVGGEVIAAYDTADSNANTVTLSAGITIPAGTANYDTGDSVEVWDVANAQPAVRYVASVDGIDGFDGSPADVIVSQGVAHVLATSMRDGTGETVTLRRTGPTGAQLELVAVDGRAFSLAQLQLIQQGMTTRQSEDDSGVDILGDASGSPGIAVYGPGGALSALLDALAGQNSFIGEIGTALPGDVGVFLYSLTFGRLGAQQTRPVIQLNVGAGRDQPSIQADTVGSANMYLFSGASSSGRETQVFVGQGQFLVGIESTGDDGLYAGAQLDLERTQVYIHTDQGVGSMIGSSSIAQLALQDAIAFVGYQSGAGDLRGFAYSPGSNDFAVIYTATTMEVIAPDASAFKAINASAFNVSSDERMKTGFRPAGDMLKIVRRAPARRFRYKGEPKSKTRIGPNADDMPRYLVGRHAKDHPVAPDMQYLNLHDLVGVIWGATAQLADENDQLRSRVDDLEARLATLEERSR